MVGGTSGINGDQDRDALSMRGDRGSRQLCLTTSARAPILAESTDQPDQRAGAH
jgi:hypothetical protein